MWGRRAKASAEEIHVPHAGRAAFRTAAVGQQIASSLDSGRTTPSELVRRYGMWVHRCVGINSSVAASVPFKLVRPVRSPDARRIGRSYGLAPLSKRCKAYLRGDMDVQPSSSVRKALSGPMDDLVEVQRHPVLDLLQDVNDWSNGYAWRESLYSDLEIFGVAYTALGNGQQPSEMWRMMPQKVRVLKHATEFVSGFELGDYPDVQRFDPDEVLWFHLYDPFDPWGGMGPLEAWLKTIDSTFHIQDFQAWLMRRGGAPDYVVNTEHPMDQPQKQAWRTEWRKLFGRLRNREESVAFMSGKNAKLERLGDSPKELEFGASEDRKRDQVGQAFGVPKAMLTTDDVNRANGRDARRQHMELTIWPRVQRVEDVINEQLVQRYGDGGMFLMHENPIREDETIRIAVRESKLRSGWSVNEAREEEGAEALEGPEADRAFVTAGLVPLDLATIDRTLDASAGESDEANAMPPSGELQTTPDAVLTGGQITAATAIIQAVADGKLPIESARGQLRVMFNLTEEQAGMMLEGVEDFEPRKPDPIPGAPPGAPAPGLPPPAEQEQEQEPPPMKIIGELVRAMKDVISEHVHAKMFNGHENGNGHPQPMHLAINVNQPDILVSLPEHQPQHVNVALPAITPTFNIREGDTHIAMPEHKSVVNVAPPGVHVEMPQQLPPVVHVASPNVHVEVPQQLPPVVNVKVPKQLPPSINVEPPNVHVEPAQVHVAAPHVTVESPTVNVEPPSVTVEAPTVNVAAPSVNVEPPSVTVESPTVNVAAPNVNVEPPSVTVEAPAVTVTPEVKPPDVRVEAPKVLVVPQIEIHHGGDD